MDNKRDFFAEELSLIRTEYIKKFLEYCIDNLPDYFFRVAASSSGKYHPEYALGMAACCVIPKQQYKLLMNCSILICSSSMKRNEI